MRVRLLTDGGYERAGNDFSAVRFPVEVEASWVEKGRLVEVTKEELNRVGVRGFIASNDLRIGTGWSFLIGTEAEVVDAE